MSGRLTFLQKEVFSKVGYITIISVFVCYLIKVLFIPELVVSPIRESQNAIMVRGFVEHGINLLYPRYDIMYPGPNWLGIEFPLYHAIIAIVQKALGSTPLWGKLVSLFSFCGSLIYLYRLLMRYTQDQWLVVFAVLFFSLFPLNSEYQTAYMADAVAVFCSFIVLFHGLRWVEEKRGKDLLICAVVGLFCSVTKPFPLVTVLVPVGYFFLQDCRGEWLSRRVVKNIVLLMAMAIVWFSSVLAWYLWSSHINSEGITYAIAGNKDMLTNNFIGPIMWRIQPGRWIGWYNSNAHYLFGGHRGLAWFFMIMGYFSLYVSYRDRKLFSIVSLWLVGFVAILIVFMEAVTSHSYYNLILLAPLSIIMACGAVGVLRVCFSERFSVLLLKLCRYNVYGPIIFFCFGIGAVVAFSPTLKRLSSFDSQSSWLLMSTVLVWGGYVLFLSVMLWGMIRQKQRGVVPLTSVMSLFAAFLFLEGMIQQTVIRDAQDRYWALNTATPWIYTNPLRQQILYIHDNLPKNKHIAIVSHRMHNYPEMLYWVGASGQMLGFPGVKGTGSCLAKKRLPKWMEPECIHYLEKYGIKDYFAVFTPITPGTFFERFTIDEKTFANRAKKMGLVEVGRFASSYDSRATVLHYRLP